MVGERAYWLAWSQVKGAGPVLIKRLYDHFGSLAVAWEAEPSELLQVEGIGLLGADELVGSRSRLQPADLLAEHEAQNRAFWTPADADYPALLFDIPDPPPVLYYRGPLRLKTAIAVGIVGTRSPSAYGRRWTHRLSARLAQQGMVIVSGLAAGIDTEAHSTCLQHQGQTVAVLGTGVNVAYPYKNKQLHRKIAEMGLLLSEYPDGTQPDRTHFPRRNRIIAGLSHALLVTEAPVRSGALITARLANDYGRDVYVLPSSLENPTGYGCLALIDQGGQIVLSEAHLLDSLGAIPVITPEAAPPDLESPLREIFSAISTEPILLDLIVQKTQMETGTVLAALIQLELLGLVTQVPGMQYQRS